MRSPLRSLLVRTAGLAVLVAACSGGSPDIDLVGDVQVAAPVAGSSQVAMTLVNRGDGDDELEGVTTEAALDVEIHRTTIADGSATMETLDGLPIPAGQELVFRPGETHLMLVVPDESVREGGTVVLVLDFARSEDLVVEGRVVDLLDLHEASAE
jgi:periplasmic copper chaperone A